TAPDGIARDAGLRPGEEPLLAEEPVDQRRLPGIGPPDHRHPDWPRAISLVAARGAPAGVTGGQRGRFRKERAQRVVEVGEALIMPGRDRDRLPATKPGRFAAPGAPPPAPP